MPRVVPPLPRRDDEDAPMRRFLGGAVIVAAAVAALAAATADMPAPVPGVALQHPALWRVEVFGGIVLVFYLLIAFIALAFHGWLPTNLGTPAGPTGLQPVTEQNAAISEQTAAIDKLTDTVTSALGDIDRRLSTIGEHLGVPPEAAEPPDDGG